MLILQCTEHRTTSSRLPVVWCRTDRKLDSDPYAWPFNGADGNEVNRLRQATRTVNTFFAEPRPNFARLLPGCWLRRFAAAATTARISFPFQPNLASRGGPLGPRSAPPTDLRRSTSLVAGLRRSQHRLLQRPSSHRPPP